MHKIFKNFLMSGASDEVMRLYEDNLGDPNDPRYAFTGGGFQTQVNVQPAPAVWGDWADTNPRASVDAGPGGLVAGPTGVTVGRFAWASYNYADGDNAPASVSNVGNGAAPTGFCFRNQQALITTYLADASMQIPSGFPVTLASWGSVWAKNEGTALATPGMYAYASFANGAISFATGTAGAASASLSGSIGPQVATWTGSIAGNQLTVSALTTGTIQVGMTVTGTGGGGVAASTVIVSQLSGTTGGVGVYSVSIPEQNVSSTAMSGSCGLLTVATLSSGTLSVGQILTGGTVSAGTIITALGTGTGGTGTYSVNNSQTTSTASLSAATNIVTKWVAMSAGAVGELVKMSSWLLG